MNITKKEIGPWNVEDRNHYPGKQFKKIVKEVVKTTELYKNPVFSGEKKLEMIANLPDAIEFCYPYGPPMMFWLNALARFKTMTITTVSCVVVFKKNLLSILGLELCALTRPQD